MQNTIRMQAAKRRLLLPCEFARGMQAERDPLIAKQEYYIVNRQLYPFGYHVEVHSYKRDLYLPMKTLSPDILTQTYKRMASSTSMSWCCRLIFVELGIKVNPYTNEELNSEFFKTRRAYRRDRYIGSFQNVDVDALINRGQFI